MEASKRSFSKSPKQKEPLTIDIVRRVCEKFVGPSCTLNDLRAALILSLGFSGLFRVGELLQLTAANVDIAGSHLEITVKRSKTDQYYILPVAKILSCLFSSCLYVIFKKYKTFSVLIYSYFNTRENWKNSKLYENTPLCGRRVSTQFLVFPISTRVDITVYQHGKCFIFLKYNIKTRTKETRKDFCHRQNA